MTMLNQNEDQKTVDRKILLEGIIERKDKEALHAWIELNFGLNIPTKKICPNHDAPFDFVSDYIFGYIDFAIVLANRSGGKTMNFGMLDTVMAYMQDNTEIATVGAIESQAQKAYEYFKDYSSRPVFAENVNQLTQTKTTHHNKSVVQVLVGTMSGVNSPHPQLLFIDEIDLMLWAILQQALSMPQSKKGIKSRTVLTSTRKFANGIMQRMMDEAMAKGHKLYQWCIWEVIEAFPTDPAKIEEIRKAFGSELPENITQADGYYTWDDALIKKNSLDPETWEVEWLCKRPGLEGVIYGSSYSDADNLIKGDWSPKGKDGFIYLFEDFGYGEGHPDVILFIWVPPTFDRLVVFDEIYIYNAGTDVIWQAIDDKLSDYGHRLPNRRTGERGTVQGWIADYHGLTEIADRKMRGAPMMEKVEDAAMYVVDNGIKAVRQFLYSGRLMITEKCVNLRLEILSYKKKKNLDGTYSKDPEKKNDHGPDALRYGIVRLFTLLARKAFGMINKEASSKEPTVQIKNNDVLPAPLKPERRSTILGNILDKQF